MNALDAQLQRVGRAEHEAAGERAERRPAPDDDGGERQVAAPAGHAVGEGADLLQRKDRAAEAGERAAGDAPRTKRTRIGSVPAANTASGFSPRRAAGGRRASAQKDGDRHEERQE